MIDSLGYRRALTLVNAECAWVLWQQQAEISPGGSVSSSDWTWLTAEATSTEAECRQVSGRTADRAKAAGETVADAIFAQAVLVQAASKMVVDGVILATDSFAKLVTEKATGGGTYLVARGSRLRRRVSGGRSAWPSRRTCRPAPRWWAPIDAARDLSQGSVRIDLSESHADFFQKNLVAIRAEQRELLAIFKTDEFRGSNRPLDVVSP